MYENTNSKSDLSSLSKSEQSNNEQLTLPIEIDFNQMDNVPTTNEDSSINEPNKQLPTKDAGWNSHSATSPVLYSEFIIHGPRKENNNSSSIETVVDSDCETKPPNEEIEKSEENSKFEHEKIFCVATIRRISPNTIKLIGISKIDQNVKVDIKSDGSSLNGYAADHSSSSTNSTVCHEQFTVPKIPRDSFMSSSSSGSLSGVPLLQSKFKSENILVSRNMYTCTDNFVCQKCNHVYPKITEKFSLDRNHHENNIQKKPHVDRKPSPKKRQVLNIKNKSSSKKTLKKKKDIKIKELKNNNIIPTNLIDEEHITFDIGDKVLAYWIADKLFYPATIIGIMPSKYRVKFTDGVEKLVTIEGLVHCEALKINSPIAVCDRVSQEYRVGEIVSINSITNGDKTYTVDLESEVVVVPFDNIVLEVESARKLQSKIVFKNYHRLSLSNVSEGKRLRSSRSTNTTEKTKDISNKRKSTSQVGPSEPKKKRKCLFPEAPDPRDIPSTSTGITEENYEMANHIVFSSDSEFDHIREDLTKVNMRKFKYSDIDSEHSSPEQDKHIIKKLSINNCMPVFKDLYFVLSYAAFKRIPTCNASDLSEDELLSNSQYFEPNKLHKKILEATICQHGGHVFKHLNIIPKSHYKLTYLITDTPSQTCNYFLSLSLGIPSYHHKYIDLAISQNLSFPEFLTRNNIKPIPNGWSVEKKSIIFRSPSTVHREIFSEYIIFLALLGVPKNEFFSGILKFCGAIVYTSWNDDGPTAPSPYHHTVIVTDEYCPTVLARSKLPKLSLHWVIQSLICESVRPFDGHESYTAINDDNSV
ncbi:Tudor domain,BRCT domain [Cinara cedri]|uniref:Tudor domain,BRCT domain n=1 Tax=Cinara cedri TaxID=506608 RepID=A0A5E4MWQ6_9HEMI|nr:Tudor domain,BRCT domain [Cinara cedri]